MAKKLVEQKRDFQSVSLLFFTVSFLGWLFETIVCAINCGRFCDRGFLTLPFCPIYGSPVCIAWLIFDKPTSGLFYRLFTRKNQKPHRQVRVLLKIGAVLAYFVTAALLATLFELVVGLGFENFGLSLWSYGNGKTCYKGVVCLEVSLFWGVLMTLCAQFLLPKIENAILSLAPKYKRGLTAILWTAVLADFAYNISYYFLKGSHFDIRRYFRR
jgi:uncharacterized membrane protein